MNAGGFAIVKRMQKAPKWLRTAGLVLAAFAGGAVTSHLANASTQSSSPYAPFEQLSRVLVLVENSYVEPAQRNKIIEGAIKGMVAELDPHSVYMNPTEYAIFQGDTEGKFGGIGVEVDYRSEFVTILAPIEGSPAERAGIKAGDQILAINGKSVRGEPIDKLVGLMRGPAGSKVRILLRRPGVADPIQMELMREEIHVQSVVSKRLADDVAYIRLRQFQEGTHEELLRAAGRVRADGKNPLKGVVLDMRNNPGGLVDEAEAVADEFLAAGAIYSTRHRGKIVDEVKAQSGGAFTAIPVVVLVNEYSASSAELVAGALQDSRGAVVVGANTFGKGSVQTIFELPGGAGLRLTTMRYYTPSGRSIQAEGIKPDFEISAPAQAAGTTPPLEIVRERDLEGHLPADSAPGAQERKATLVMPGNTAAAGTTPVVVSVKDIPYNPTKGQDFALSVAYQLLLKGPGAKR
jgi:carboxyl-terminal processing protease